MTRRFGHIGCTRHPIFVGLILALIGLSWPLETDDAQAIGNARQVTVFGVLASPGTATDDPKLKEILPQLRTLLPGHSFKLVKIDSKRLTVGQSVNCELGDGFIAASQLTIPNDPNGKIQMRFDLSLNGLPQYQTILIIPPGEVVYVNRMFPNGQRLVIGVGAR